MVEPTHLKNMLVKLYHLPRDPGEKKNIWNDHLDLNYHPISARMTPMNEKKHNFSQLSHAMLCFSPRGQGDVVTEDPTRTGMWSPQNGNTEEFHIWALRKRAPGCSGDEMLPTLLEEFRKKKTGYFTLDLFDTWKM